MPLLIDLKQRARRLKAETFALYLAARHPGTPWYAKLFVAGIVAYALSPIDLIPDFVPVLGYVDDFLLIPLGIALAIKMIPAPVLAECRARAQAVLANGKPVSRVAGVVIVVIWFVVAALCLVWAYEAYKGSEHEWSDYGRPLIIVPFMFRPRGRVIYLLTVTDNASNPKSSRSVRYDPSKRDRHRD